MPWIEKFGLSEKHTNFEKNLPCGFDVYLVNQLICQNQTLTPPKAWDYTVDGAALVTVPTPTNWQYLLILQYFVRLKGFTVFF